MNQAREGAPCPEPVLAAIPWYPDGLSDDFEIAIEEGASIVRVGTAIFGPREERA